MGFVAEFKQFAMKGNVVDLAVGVIIGAAFGKIVDSVVKDLIMPLVGKVTGGLDFSSYFIVLSPPPPGYAGPMTYEALTKAGVPLFAYGNFITVALNFISCADHFRDGQADQPASQGDRYASSAHGRHRAAPPDPRRAQEVKAAPGGRLAVKCSATASGRMLHRDTAHFRLAPYLRDLYTGFSFPRVSRCST